MKNYDLYSLDGKCVNLPAMADNLTQEYYNLLLLCIGYLF